MNDQPSHTQFRAPSFGAPPPSPSGASRLLPLMRTAATGGLMVALALYGAQLILPDFLKPSRIAGWAAGDTVRGEIDASKEAKIDLDRRIADATAQANAKAQADLLAIQKALDERTESLKPLSTLAGLADIFCLGGQAVAALGSQNTGADWHNGAQSVAASTCGVGDRVRQAVTQSQLDSVRSTTAARGAPMSNGAQPIPLAPAGNAPPPSMRVIEAQPVTKAPHSQWSDLQQGQLRAYSYSLPVDVLQRIVTGLDVTRGYPEAWYDRVAAYQAAHRG